VTVTNSYNSEFRSNDGCLVSINGMIIYNNRSNKDFAYLYSSHWSGILVGTDGYPTTNGLGSYYIAGFDQER
jgi:hypothetical protein